MHAVRVSSLFFKIGDAQEDKKSTNAQYTPEQSTLKHGTCRGPEVPDTPPLRVECYYYSSNDKNQSDEEFKPFIHRFSILFPYLNISLVSGILKNNLPFLAPEGFIPSFSL